MENVFVPNYDKTVAELDAAFRLKASFDLLGREVKVGSRRARLYLVDGFCKDDLMEKIMAYFMKATDDVIQGLADTRAFADTYVPYVETDVVAKRVEFITAVLSGAVGMIVEGFAEAIVIDARTYPSRSVDEPENDRVLRGAHDGFVETIVFNTALIRRRIRDTALTMEAHSAGEKAKTDIVICYMDGKAKPEQLDVVRKKIDGIRINSLSMSQQS